MCQWLPCRMRIDIGSGVGRRFRGRTHMPIMPKGRCLGQLGLHICAKTVTHRGGGIQKRTAYPAEGRMSAPNLAFSTQPPPHAWRKTNLQESTRASRLDLTTGRTTACENSRCRVVLRKVSPERRGAEPRAQPPTLLGALADVRDPYPIRREERPQRGKRPASRINPRSVHPLSLWRSRARELWLEGKRALTGRRRTRTCTTRWSWTISRPQGSATSVSAGSSTARTCIA